MTESESQSRTIEVEKPRAESAVGQDADEPAEAAPQTEKIAATGSFPAPSRAVPGEDRITFSDVVRAHKAWEHELYEYEHEGRKQGPRKAIEDEFRNRWAKFEMRYGRIDDAFWSIRDASAVALTIKEEPVRRRWFHEILFWRPDHELRPRFHRATDWATQDEPKIAEALDECETLAVRAEEILRGPSELIALRRIHAVASHILGFVDREWGREEATPDDRRTRDEDERDTFVARQRQELAKIEYFYNGSGNQQARIMFFWGMAQGLLALAVLTIVTSALAFLIDHLDGGKLHWGIHQLFVISVMAGALGAILSVLSRMASLTGKFDLDHELGRKNVRWIGIYRPFVGGIFGAATFLMLASGILQTESPGADQEFAYYGILALFSGFFERFTKLTPTGAPTPLAEAKGEEGKKEGTS